MSGAGGTTGPDTNAQAGKNQPQLLGAHWDRGLGRQRVNEQLNTDGTCLRQHCTIVATHCLKSQAVVVSVIVMRLSGSHEHLAFTSNVTGAWRANMYPLQQMIPWWDSKLVQRRSVWCTATMDERGACGASEATRRERVRAGPARRPGPVRHDRNGPHLP